MTIPDVKRAAVAITQSAQSAQSAEIVAHVVPEAGGVEVSQLSAQLRTILPAYMVPQRVMIHSALPLTASGKIDRQALTESIAPQRHGSKLASDEVPRQAPVQTTGSDLQATIAAAWQAVLGVSAVNGDDNFFQLGGDSLQAMRVVSQLARDLQADIDLRDIFDAPTPREFAVLVAGKSNVAPAKEASGMHDLESLLDEIEVLTAEQVLEALER
jgi:fengycin family lipopeptide synthetase D/tyrocidine synthetase-2